MASKVIRPLRYDDRYREGTGPTLDEAVMAAHRQFADVPSQQPPEDSYYDLFVRVTVRADGTLVYEALLRG